MKTHPFFLPLLMFLTGFLAADSISPNEAKLKKTKLPKIKKENHVLLLKPSNFDRALKETKYLLVKFCEYQFPLPYPGGSAENDWYWGSQECLFYHCFVS